jgi:hypothetical protein
MLDEPACFIFERFLNFNREAHEAIQEIKKMQQAQKGSFLHCGANIGSSLKMANEVHAQASGWFMDYLEHTLVARKSKVSTTTNRRNLDSCPNCSLTMP